MPNRAQFQDIFDKLKLILVDYADKFACVRDSSGDFYLDTTYVMKNKKPLFFSAVQIKKNYVSYRLMPVYVFPELLQDIDAQLKHRMQGKSCFNFTSVDDRLFSELAELTKTGFKRYEEAGYV